MPVFWDQWNTDPAQNIGNPPAAGAGEYKLTFDQISDTFRVVMAACRDLGNRVGGLGSMSAQNANGVSITGGTISSNVNINAQAVKSGELPLTVIPNNLTGKLADGLTPHATQILYNLIYPIGRIMLWHTNTPGGGLYWPGIVATWQEVAGSQDRMICTHGGLTVILNGGGTQPLAHPSIYGTSLNGAHDHGAITGATALTIAQMPSHFHNVPGVAGAGGTEGTGGLGGGGRNTDPVGGGQGHQHSITGVGNHSHTVGIDQARYAMALIQRIA